MFQYERCYWRMFYNSVSITKKLRHYCSSTLHLQSEWCSQLLSTQKKGLHHTVKRSYVNVAGTGGLNICCLNSLKSLRNSIIILNYFSSKFHLHSSRVVWQYHSLLSKLFRNLSAFTVSWPIKRLFINCTCQRS